MGRVRHPDWLHKRLSEKNDLYKQRRVTDLFQVLPKKRANDDVITDIEDLGGGSRRPQVAVVTKKQKLSQVTRGLFVVVY